MQYVSPSLALQRFCKAYNPSKPLRVGEAEDQQYYIDFSSVRGNQIIQSLRRTIALISPDEPTCQLFTGSIGCGKSTELLRLKGELEQQGYYVVYFDSSQDLDMTDVDITDILLSVAGRVSESLEAIKIKLKPGYFANLFSEIANLLQTSIELSAAAQLSISMGKITAKTKEITQLRRRLREYLEPRISGILESINTELLGRAILELRRLGKAGLVVIVDNLDRIDNYPLPSGRLPAEYLFIDRGDQLRKLNCHVIYTIPLSLTFSNDVESLKNRLGGGLPPTILPMVPVRERDGLECKEGMNLLRQMVLARALPDLDEQGRLNWVNDIFDNPDSLDRLCRISGGHVRDLLQLLIQWLQTDLKQGTLTSETLEGLIRSRRNEMTLTIDDHEWALLRKVRERKQVSDDDEYKKLIDRRLVYVYHDGSEFWFDVNPILAEAEEFQR